MPKHISQPSRDWKELDNEQRKKKWIQWGRDRVRRDPNDRPTQLTARLKYGWPPAHEFKKTGCFPEGLNGYCMLIGANTAREKHTDEELISILRNWSLKKRLAPRTYHFDTDPKLPCSRTYSDRFGTWTNALQMALGDSTDEFLQGYRFWRRWQRFCVEIAKDLYGQVITNKVSGIEGMVDIFIPHENLVIDAMTSSYAHSHKESEIERYILPGNRLEFWCLDRGRYEYSHPNLSYVYLEELKKRLQAKGLAKKIKKLEKFSTLESGDFTKRELCEFLKQIHRNLGRPVNTIDVENAPPPVPNVKVFNKTLAKGKGFTKVCEVAGVPYSESSFNRRYSKDELLTILKKIVKSGKPIVDALLDDPHLPSPSTYTRHFGSLGKALKHIGINQTHTLSDEQIINRLRKACKNFGGPISSNKCGPKLGLPSSRTYSERFGSWRKALHLAGYPSPLKIWNKKAIIPEIIRYYEQYKKWPSAPDFDRSVDYPSSSSVKKHFEGSFVKARNVAIKMYEEKAK